MLKPSRSTEESENVSEKVKEIIQKSLSAPTPSQLYRAPQVAPPVRQAAPTRLPVSAGKLTF